MPSGKLWLLEQQATCRQAVEERRQRHEYWAQAAKAIQARH